MAMLDAESTLAAQLDALARQSYSGWWELVIADNGCSDRSRSVVDDVGDRIRHMQVIDASHRRSRAYARNLAASAALGEIIMSCDADDVVDEHWIEALVDELSNSDVAVGITDKEALNSGRVNSWYWTPMQRPQTVVSGGNFGCWRNVFESIGGFDEGLPRHSDADFGLRAASAGFRIGFTRHARVLVRRRSTLRSVAARAFEAGRWNLRLRATHRRSLIQRTALWLHTLRNLGFVALCWPGALVSGSFRGLWVRVAAYELGQISGRLQLCRQRLTGSWPTRGRRR
jgi:glycosyltransferase involved in cell wall biosynthesis